MNTISNRRYPVDFAQYLVTLVFFKDSKSSSDVDAIVVRFLDGFREEGHGKHGECVLWRGEYVNSYGVAMWVLGLSDAEDDTAHVLLSKAAAGMSDDFGTYSVQDTGCSPYLLVCADALWQFLERPSRVHAGTLVLAGRSLPVQFAVAVPKSETMVREDDTREEPGGEVADILREWEAELGESPAENWPSVSDSFPRLLYANCGELSARTLDSSVQRFLRIPVVDVDMQPLGTTSVSPQWVDEGDTVAVADYSVVIALKQGLSPNQRLVALAHELAHYAHHFPFLRLFADMYATIQERPAAEAEIAEVLTDEWWDRYFTITELRADVAASYFVVPVRAEQAVEAIRTHTLGPTLDSEGHRLMWLEYFFDPHGGPPSFAKLKHTTDSAYMTKWNLAGKEYSADAMSLRDRIAWCVFNRSSALKRLTEGEPVIRRELTSVARMMNAVAARAQSPRRHLDERVLSRMTLEQMGGVLGDGREHWHPLIVEPRRRAEPVGYLAITPSICSRGNTSGEWAAWVMRGQGPVGSIAEWLSRAEGRGQGLMVYPLTPAQVQHRSNVIEALKGEGS